MSNNIPKKLALKAELIKHLETAKSKMDKGESSSFMKVVYLARDIGNLDKGIEPTVNWDRLMNPN